MASNLSLHKIQILEHRVHNFLQIPVGARSEAMGGAIVGLADDASAIFWNPAGIVKVNNVQAHFSYMKWFDLFDFNAASLVYNAGDIGSLVQV